jgi:hypothetical protein
LADAGRYLGKMDVILDTFNKSTDDDGTATKRHSTSGGGIGIIYNDDSLWIPARRFHAWDGKNTLELRKFLHYIKDDARRALITSIINTFEHDIIKSNVAQQFRLGLNHGDYNDANILVNNNDLMVSGVLDFGDSVERYVCFLRTVLLVACCCVNVRTAAPPTRVHGLRVLFNVYCCVWRLHKSTD